MNSGVSIARACAGLALMGAMLAAPGAARAMPLNVTFTKIADTSTAIPGGGGSTFTGFGPAPALYGGSVAFRGLGLRGIYAGAGGALGVVADTSTPIPGGSGNFTNFVDPSLSGGNAAFLGQGSGGQAGIYTDIGGTLGVVADKTTAIPGGSGAFTNFIAPSLSGGAVAFGGSGSGQAGVYTDVGGTLGVVADLSTTIPGGSGTFTGFLVPPTLSGGDVAFTAFGSGGQTGIYTNVGGTLGVVANLNTAVPGGSGNFISLSSTPTISGGNVAFTGFGSGGHGLYANVGGTLGVVADSSTPIPGGSGSFLVFNNPTISGGDVAFVGDGSGGQRGLYVDIGGVIDKVIDLNDMLDSKSLSDFNLFRGFDGASLAFWADFNDGSSGIFRADLAAPEPGSLALFAAGLLGLGFLRRRRVCASR